MKRSLACGSADLAADDPRSYQLNSELNDEVHSRRPTWQQVDRHDLYNNLPHTSFMPQLTACPSNSRKHRSPSVAGTKPSPGKPEAPPLRLVIRKVNKRKDHAAAPAGLGTAERP